MPETAESPLKSYSVPFDSMEPAIVAGSDVVGDVSYYAKHQPARWEVVVFTVTEAGKAGPDDGRFVKRIIGLPGETIHLTPKGLKINGAMLAIPSLLKDRFSTFAKHEDHKCGAEPHKIPADSVFLIGDNHKAYVTDSRELGAIPIRNLEARVLALVKVTPIA